MVNQLKASDKRRYNRLEKLANAVNYHISIGPSTDPATKKSHIGFMVYDRQLGEFEYGHYNDQQSFLCTLADCEDFIKCYYHRHNLAWRGGI